MLGRFLEVSVRCRDIPASLEFYESIGFVQAPVGDTWTHPYAVVTDGRLYLGLHDADISSPALTWVWPELARHAAELGALGIVFAYARLDEDHFHEVGFDDPSGQAITVVEARTFSPLALGHAPTTICGYFEEYGMPVANLETSAAFWDRLGLIAFDPVRVPFSKVVVSSSDLNIGLYDVEMRGPVLTFSDAQMADRIGTLREHGHALSDALPRGLDPATNAILQAPEGTRLLLTTDAG
jgi:catechol 2,3-dioxygenase-like lactoylglutathione lyase family enzyme